MAKDSLAFLSKYLATFSSEYEESYVTNETKEEAVRAIIEFVKSPDMFQVSNWTDVHPPPQPSPLIMLFSFILITFSFLIYWLFNILSFSLGSTVFFISSIGWFPWVAISLVHFLVFF